MSHIQILSSAAPVYRAFRPDAAGATDLTDVLSGRVARSVPEKASHTWAVLSLQIDLYNYRPCMFAMKPYTLHGLCRIPRATGHATVSHVDTGYA